MKFSDWLKLRTEYQIKARNRADERRTVGDDSEFWVRVVEEMMMEHEDRLKKIEDILFDKTAKR